MQHVQLQRGELWCAQVFSTRTIQHQAPAGCGLCSCGFVCLLQFATGTSRVPVQGFKALQATHACRAHIARTHAYAKSAQRSRTLAHTQALKAPGRREWYTVSWGSRELGSYSMVGALQCRARAGYRRSVVCDGPAQHVATQSAMLQCSSALQRKPAVATALATLGLRPGRARQGSDGNVKYFTLQPIPLACVRACWRLRACTRAGACVRAPMLRAGRRACARVLAAVLQGVDVPARTHVLQSDRAAAVRARTHTRSHARVRAHTRL
jgi:hypothetical protein